MTDFTVEEGYFLKTAIKDALSALNAARTKIAGTNDMVELMAAEELLADAESAWEKLKRML